jgi:hypothetical protein
MKTELDVLKNLVEYVLEAVAEPRYEHLKDMWTRHNRLEKVEKVPVSIHLHGGYPVIWQELIPSEQLLCKEPLAKAIELQLRQKLYRHRFIPDDDVLLPTIWLNPVKPTTSGGGTFQEVRATGGHEISAAQGAEHSELTEMAQLWGLPFKVQQTSVSGGAYKVEPVVKSEADLGRLRHASYVVDNRATLELVDRVTEMVGGQLPVKIASDEVRASPSETVVSLMGMDAILYGVYDRPEMLHKMMDFITDGTIAYQRSREAAGVVDVEESWSYRTHFEKLPEGADPKALKNHWTYISAQSLCGLSPTMYEEFLQPYHERLSTVLGEDRVYYHGCEDLTLKIPIIRKLPNLRRFHISAWTNLESAVDQLGQEFVLESNVHGPDTWSVYSEDDMRQSVKGIMDIAGDAVTDINVTDVETTFGDPNKLTRWALIAQDVTTSYAG